MLDNISFTQMTEVDISKIDKKELTDVSNIKIDTSATLLQRISQYLSQVQNPYLFRVGDVGVKVSYADTETTLQETLLSLIRRIQER